MLTKDRPDDEIGAMARTFAAAISAVTPGRPMCTKDGAFLEILERQTERHIGFRKYSLDRVATSEVRSSLPEDAFVRWVAYADSVSTRYARIWPHPLDSR